jgi:hypothetical protein
VIGRIQSSRRDKRTGNAIASLAAIGRFRLVVGAQCWGNVRSLRKRRACFESDPKLCVHERLRAFLEICVARVDYG